ncbi:MAG: hypothetical protein QW728_06490, partial [Thermoplasmata archaeon]
MTEDPDINSDEATNEDNHSGKDKNAKADDLDVNSLINLSTEDLFKKLGLSNLIDEPAVDTTIPADKLTTHSDSSDAILENPKSSSEKSLSVSTTAGSLIDDTDTDLLQELDSSLKKMRVSLSSEKASELTL